MPGKFFLQKKAGIVHGFQGDFRNLYHFFDKVYQEAFLFNSRGHVSVKCH